MEIQLKDATVTHTIVGLESNEHNFTIDLGNACIQDAYNETLKVLHEAEANDLPTSAQHTATIECLKVALGAEQYAELEAMGGTSVPNADRLFAALVKDFEAYNQENDAKAILAEFGL